MASRGKLRAELRKAVYSGVADQDAADIINLKDKTLPAPPVELGIFYNLIDGVEFNSRSAVEKEEIRDIYFVGGPIDIVSSRQRTAIDKAFAGPTGATTRAAFVAAETIPASTADIDGLGEVRGSDVEKARFTP